MGETRMRTTEGRKELEEANKFVPFPYLPIPSIPCSNLQVSDSLRGSNSIISAVKDG
jgi:hypothetical protein